mmetsp:Transcript_46750/g.149200  ORF Transcript_46750/g.149200 Transcript_46750/m.149200 type:complete len:234 (+) Transcript_46750:1533-2234(+)
MLGSQGWRPERGGGQSFRPLSPGLDLGSSRRTRRGDDRQDPRRHRAAGGHGSGERVGSVLARARRRRGGRRLERLGVCAEGHSPRPIAGELPVAVDDGRADPLGGSGCRRREQPQGGAGGRGPSSAAALDEAIGGRHETLGPPAPLRHTALRLGRRRVGAEARGGAGSVAGHAGDRPEAELGSAGALDRHHGCLLLALLVAPRLFPLRGCGAGLCLPGKHAHRDLLGSDHGAA